MLMEATDLYTARVQGFSAMEQGLSWHEAAKRAGLEISQSNVYRLRQRMRQGGEQALREGRHGHPIKLRGEERQWFEQTWKPAPQTPSHEIQTQLAQRFSLQVSVSQIYRMRSTLGVSNLPQSAKKSEQAHRRAGGRRSSNGRLQGWQKAHKILRVAYPAFYEKIKFVSNVKRGIPEEP